MQKIWKDLGGNMEEIRLKNDNILIVYDNRDITVYDLKDINETTAYTTSKRNLKKCWDEIVSDFNDEKIFNNITNMFSKYNIKYRRYCGLD